MVKKILQKKILTSLCFPILLATLGYLTNFFLNVFPNTQAEVKLLNVKYDNLGEDIREIKDNQKQFTKDQKTLIKFLLENSNDRRKNRKND